jgi:hypothetical protein
MLELARHPGDLKSEKGGASEVGYRVTKGGIAACGQRLIKSHAGNVNSSSCRRGWEVSLSIRWLAPSICESFGQRFAKAVNTSMLIELRLNQIEHYNGSYSANHCCASFVTKLLALRLLEDSAPATAAFCARPIFSATVSGIPRHTSTS